VPGGYRAVIWRYGPVLGGYIGTVEEMRVWLCGQCKDALEMRRRTQGIDATERPKSHSRRYRDSKSEIPFH
jgi:hypothetical protein